VVDPSHYLFGRTFPLLGIVSKAYLGRCCVIWLDETEQFVPLAATDRSPEPRIVYPLPLSVSAIRQFVAVYADIELQLTEEEIGYERSQTAADDELASDINPNG
jgi:hypothetical protein